MKIKVKANSLIKIVSTIILIFILLFSISSCCISTPLQTSSETTLTSEDKTEETTSKEKEAKETKDASAIQTDNSSDETLSDLIKVTNPSPNQIVESPLIIEGEARGTWFFEADFPVTLLDANGNVIFQHYATAQGEWMTENFVPFRAEIEFEKPATDNGVLVLEKNNPSGLPEHDAKIEIPVRFINK